jgi:hypothetical protein
VLGASLVVSEQVYGTDFNFASARSTGVRDRPDLSYGKTNTRTGTGSFQGDNQLIETLTVTLMETLAAVNNGGWQIAR